MYLSSWRKRSSFHLWQHSCIRGRRVAFLDRDGVLIQDSGYPHKISDLKILPEAISICHHLQNAGYCLVIITNQSGISRQLFSESDYAIFTNAMLTEFSNHRISFRAVLACPHLASGTSKAYARFCLCRKPRPGAFQRVLRRMGASKTRALMIGDKTSDMTAARSAGLATRIFLPQPIGPENHTCRMQNRPAMQQRLKLLRVLKRDRGRHKLALS